MDGLYVAVLDLLGDPVRSGTVRFDYRPKVLTEDFLGSYAVRELAVYLGEQAVVFSPKARNVVGAAGRVDVVGEMGEATLVLQPGPRWGVVVQRAPTVRVVELNENSLLTVLRTVMRP